MIKVENLSKTFGPKVAVNDVSFTLERGEILGFLGPNGAGKSTTMRMITGYIPPTAGVVKVGGNDVTEKPIEAKRLMGYLQESAPLYTDMTVEGFLGFCAEVRGIKGADKDKAIDRAIDMCFLKSVRHQSVDTLSKGFRHRTGFAQAIIHDPDILIMDEPTDGLDPNQKHEVRSLIRRMGQSKAIIFSTHILEEVEASCTRAIIIDQGKIVANGTPLSCSRTSRASSRWLQREPLRDRLRSEAQGCKRARRSRTSRALRSWAAHMVSKGTPAACSRQSRASSSAVQAPPWRDRPRSCSRSFAALRCKVRSGLKTRPWTASGSRRPGRRCPRRRAWRRRGGRRPSRGTRRRGR